MRLGTNNMAQTLNLERAQKIVMAYKQNCSIDDCQNVFVNPFGQILYVQNEHNYTVIGRIINDDRFEIKGLKYSF